jgi:hypothetical protein
MTDLQLCLGVTCEKVGCSGVLPCRFPLIAGNQVDGKHEA